MPRGDGCGTARGCSQNRAAGAQVETGRCVVGINVGVQGASTAHGSSFTATWSMANWVCVVHVRCDLLCWAEWTPGVTPPVPSDDGLTWCAPQPAFPCQFA